MSNYTTYVSISIDHEQDPIQFTFLSDKLNWSNLETLIQSTTNAIEDPIILFYKKDQEVESLENQQQLQALLSADIKGLRLYAQKDLVTESVFVYPGNAFVRLGNLVDQHKEVIANSRRLARWVGILASIIAEDMEDDAFDQEFNILEEMIQKKIKKQARHQEEFVMVNEDNEKEEVTTGEEETLREVLFGRAVSGRKGCHHHHGFGRRGGFFGGRRGHHHGFGGDYHGGPGGYGRPSAFGGHHGFGHQGGPETFGFFGVRDSSFGGRGRRYPGGRHGGPDMFGSFGGRVSFGCQNHGRGAFDGFRGRGAFGGHHHVRGGFGGPGGFGESDFPSQKQDESSGPSDADPTSFSAFGQDPCESFLAGRDRCSRYGNNEFCGGRKMHHHRRGSQSSNESEDDAKLFKKNKKQYKRFMRHGGPENHFHFA